MLPRDVRRLSVKASHCHVLDVPAAPRLASSSIADVFTKIIDLLPRLNSLTLDAEWWGAVRSLVFSRCHQWKALNVSAGTVFGGEQTWIDLPNLQELVCHGLFMREAIGSTIPSTLQVLRLNSNRPQILKGSPDSHLKVLHVVGSPETLSNIGDFQALQHLHIFRGLECQPLIPSSAFSAFSQLSHLRSLSLVLWSIGDPTLTATLPPLLAHLPPSLDRLDFPERIPIKVLTAYLNLETTPPFRSIGYSHAKYQDVSEKHLSIIGISYSARLKGIEVQHIGK